MACGRSCWVHDDLSRRGVRQLHVRISEQKHGEHCAAEDANADACQHEDGREYETDVVCSNSNRHVSPEHVAIVGSLKLCSKQKDTGKGSILHADILKRGLLSNIFIGNALLNVYAKCGALAKAQLVFDELLFKTIVSWTTVISGYCQHGYCEQALSCFHQMQLGGFFPNKVTFLSILKACGGMGAIRRGEEIHEEIARRGLLMNDNVLGTALVDMYAKCGALARAQLVFEELPGRDIVSWNVLLAGYIQHGYSEVALNYYKQIKSEGLVANCITFACLLRACGCTGAADIGTEIHNEIAEMGFLRNDGLLGAALVEMYAALGLISKAQEVFEELLTRNAACWNVLIAAHSEYGQFEEALKCFDVMKLEGVTPNEITFACTLRACGEIGADGKGEELHDEIVRKGLLGKDDVLLTALVHMYVKCGSMSVAQQVLDKFSVQDVVSWNALITGYCQQGFCTEAFNCFQAMKRKGISPSSITFACLLKACSISDALEKGKMIHLEIVRGGLLEKVGALGNALVDMYGKCGDLAMAQQVFDQLPMQDVVSWTALIAGYSQHGQSQKALCCFQLMKHVGFSPDAVTFSCVLYACASIKDIEKGKEIHEEISREGLLEKDNVLAAALLDVYAKCGAFSLARQVFDQLPVRDVVSWNVLLAGYCEHGRSEEALECFDQMNHEGVSPDAVSFVLVLKVCGSTGASVKGEEIHAEMVREELLEKVGILGSVLVDMYAKCGAVSKAQEVFEELPERDVVSWTALIAGYAQTGRHDFVFHLLKKMIEEGIEPNVVTLLVVLSACSYSGLEDHGQMFFEDIKMSSTGPTFKHYTCMVDLFGRMGKLSKAVDMIKKMPSSDHLPMWFALLGACQKWGDAKLALLAFNSAVELDDKSPVPYLFMSKIYAAAGMQEEAKKLEAIVASEKLPISGYCHPHLLGVEANILCDVIVG
ncbi:hypothetical protein GOP47_0023322 [Adiantum capillus-veneris]|uniref:Pentatricopeptide repeat-containing protein n=1 Tax=Adiantum capillus-veneris TaxID=13818 RepID=A0A9D4Z541_ADICA|nr:hypothetical protein GOP47_0023322 [Adiantum capillus-veneris]